MKQTIKLEDFMSYNKIDFQDPMRIDAYYNYAYDADTLAGYTGIEYTRDQIEASPTLKDALNVCIARAEESSYIDAYYIAQCHAIKDTAQSICDWINENYPKCKIKITDFQNPDYAGSAGSMTIEGDARALANVCREIIEGEGMFGYNGSTLDFIQSYDGTNKPAQAVAQHMHYLLNGKLIGSIWGDNLAHEVDDRAIDRLNDGADKDHLKEIINDEVIGNTDIEDELQVLKYQTL